MRRMFGRRQGTLSHIFHLVVWHIDQKFSHVLQEMNIPWPNEEDFYLYAGVIPAEGGVTAGCFGFKDGNARPIARPKRFQRHCFSGHKRQHCVKWKSIILPNGLMCNLHGRHRGFMHDSHLLKRSQMVENFLQNFDTFYWKRFVIHGDQGTGKDHL